VIERRRPAAPPDDDPGASRPDPHAENPDVPPAPRPQRTGAGPGMMLRAERERQSLSREEVADALHLLVRVIADLEDENWARLPNPTFARGYYRAYAKLLELDVEAVTAAYRSVAPGPAPDPEQRVRHRSGPEAVLRSTSSVVPILIWIVVIGLVLLVGGWLWQEIRAPAPSVTPAPPQQSIPRGSGVRAPVPAGTPAPIVAEPVRSPAPEPAGAQPAVPLERTVSEPARTADVAPPAESVSADDGRAAAAPEGTQPTMAPSEDAMYPAAGTIDVPVRRLTPDGDDYLVFRFADDCWVDIRTQDGRTLYGNLSRAGDELVLAGAGPFRVLLGNAPGVEVTFNGEPVRIRPTRNNVASFTVGAEQ
jgi:cytoskeleton protein RodZ